MTDRFGKRAEIIIAFARLSGSLEGIDQKMRALAFVFFILGMLGSLGLVEQFREDRETLLTSITLCLVLFAYCELARRAVVAPPTGRLVRGTGYVLISLGAFAIALSVEDVLFGPEALAAVGWGIGFALLFGLPGFLLVRLGWRNAELEVELEELKSREHARDS